MNTDSTGVALQFSDLSGNEIDYFRKVVSAITAGSLQGSDGIQTEEIITSYPGNSIGSNYALSLVSDLQSAMKRTEAEKLLGGLVVRGWLRKSKSAFGCSAED